MSTGGARGLSRGLGVGVGPAEVRAAVEGAQRYFHKVSADLETLNPRL
jgi:hypothetical protein